MDLSDIYRILPQRITDSIDRLADSYLPDAPPTGNRLADAMERIAAFTGATVHNTGDRTMDALDAIVSVIVDGKEHEAAGIGDFNSLMNGEEEKFVAVLSSDINAGSTGIAISVPVGKKATIDLNGHSITGNNTLIQVSGGEAVIKNGTIDGVGHSVTVTNGGKLVIEDAQILSTASNAVSVYDGGSLTVESGKLKAQEFGVLVTTGAELVINGGIIEGVDNCSMGGNGTAGQGDTVMTINGGTLISHISTPGYIACGIYSPNSGIINFNGGEIISDGCGICMRAGQVNINGGTIRANGATNVFGKVGDSRVVVGPYAVVYDESAKYPAADTLELNIASGAKLIGTDGDIQILLSEGAVSNIHDLR